MSGYRMEARFDFPIDQAEKNVFGRKTDIALGDGAFDKRDFRVLHANRRNR
jgi:hypothetical protein